MKSVRAQYLYFVRINEGICKIGITSVLSQRIPALKRQAEAMFGNPSIRLDRILQLDSRRSARFLEFCLLYKFQDKIIKNREWMNLGQDDMEFIRNMHINSIEDVATMLLTELECPDDAHQDVWDYIVNTECNSINGLLRHARIYKQPPKLCYCRSKG